MSSQYQARWISRPRAVAVKKSGHRDALVLDTLNGILLIEPVGSHLGDGPVLNRREADYELQPVWYTGTTAKLLQARQMLGLDVALVEKQLVSSQESGA